MYCSKSVFYFLQDLVASEVTEDFEGVKLTKFSSFQFNCGIQSFFIFTFHFRFLMPFFVLAGT